MRCGHNFGLFGRARFEDTTFGLHGADIISLIGMAVTEEDTRNMKLQVVAELVDGIITAIDEAPFDGGIEPKPVPAKKLELDKIPPQRCHTTKWHLGNILSVEEYFRQHPNVEREGEMRTVPSGKAHQLTSGHKGTWSLFVTKNWRIRFQIDQAEVEIIDVNYENCYYEVAMATAQGLRMKNPAHPNDFVKRGIIEAPGLSVTDAAHPLGVTRPALSALMNEREPIAANGAAYRKGVRSIDGYADARAKQLRYCTGPQARK